METLRSKRSVYIITTPSSFHVTNKQIKGYLMLELRVNETVKARGSSTKQSK